MKNQLPETPLFVEGDWETDWVLSAPSLQEVKDLLGMSLLVQFCRCSVAADRLTSLGDFRLFNDEWRPRLAVAHMRNLQTMFWFAWGTIHEATDALSEMELLGIEGLLGSFDARKPWLDLRSIVSRWNADPIYQRVRNKIVFHLDPGAIRKGINKPGRDAEPVTWKKGNTTKDRSTAFAFPQDCLVSFLFPEELTDAQAGKRFGELAESIRNVHLGFSQWVQELFVAALRGASLGLNLTPVERPRTEGLAEERLAEIVDLADGPLDDLPKRGLMDLVAEVRRLTNIVKRTDNDPAAAEAQRRRDDDERRLRAIAATAREFLIGRAAATEDRLRELLGLGATG